MREQTRVEGRLDKYWGVLSLVYSKFSLLGYPHQYPWMKTCTYDTKENVELSVIKKNYNSNPNREIQCYDLKTL